MKKLITTVVIVIAITTVSIGQCTALFSFAAYFTTVTFSNQSTVSNAHYFWNFGDGTGSNFVNPIHTFPDNGDYLVTLFAEDTVSKCSSYYEYWVDVTKYSSNPCQPSISDSLYFSGDIEYFDIYNTSANCNGYTTYYSGGPSCNFSSGLMPIYLRYFQTVAFRMVCMGQYYDSFGNLQRRAFRTADNNYSSSHNYGDCSANFEFKVVSKDSSGERILFTAMNKTAVYYEWDIAGFGNPITSNYDTISQVYPLYPPGPSTCFGIVSLIIQGSSGCHDTIFQDIFVDDSTSTVLGINDVKNNVGEVRVYPNPSNGTFTLALSNVNAACNVEIYNMLGENIYNTKLNPTNTILSLSGQPNGVYFYRVLTESGALLGSGKFVISH